MRDRVDAGRRYLRRPSVSSWIDVLHAEARRRQLSASQIAMITQAVDRGDAAPPELQGVAATDRGSEGCMFGVGAAPAPPGVDSRQGSTVLLIVAVARRSRMSWLIALLQGRSFSLKALLASVCHPSWWGGQLRGARRAVELNGGSRIEEPTNAGAADRNGTDT